MTKAIAFVHHKGGTGKTTACLNIAGWLAKTGKKVLVVDLDPQGNATAGLGVDRNTLDGSLFDVLCNDENIREVILNTECGISLAPSSMDLLAAETHMAGRVAHTSRLKEQLADVERYFDCILLDVPPGSTMLMITGIVAAENIIIPLDSGVFAYEAMETLRTLLADLNEELDVETNLIMVLLREHTYGAARSPRGPTAQVKKLAEEFLAANRIPHVPIFTIPYSTRIYRAQLNGLPISHYSPDSRVGRKYEKLAREVLDHV